MVRLPFNQRFGLDGASRVTEDFPESARIAFAYLLHDLVDRNYLDSLRGLYTEFARTGRLSGEEMDFGHDVPLSSEMIALLKQLDWRQVYILCERVYDQLLSEVREPYYIEEDVVDENVVVSLAEVQAYYTNELNFILAEESIDYRFIDGEFQRRGRAQTQKNVQRAGTILTDPELSSVLKHYKKALEFFRSFPEPDTENCVKEAVCALEACLEILSEKSTSTNFARTVKQLMGNEPKQIPHPIAQSMIKLHAFRGSGQGVAHAALEGSRVSEIEAELVLSLVAAYITYLYDLLAVKDASIPF